jgi:hypothetical protein
MDADDGDSSTLTDDQHDWTSQFTGVDTRGTSGNGSGGFDADAYFNQTLQSQGYTVGNDPRLDKCWEDFRNCLKSPPPGQGPDYCLAQLTTCQRAAGSANQDQAGAADSAQQASAGDTGQQPAGDAGTQAPAGDTGQQTTGDTGTQAPASDQSQQPAGDQSAQAPTGDTGQQTAGDAATQTPAGDAGGQAQQGAASFDPDAYFNKTLQSQGYTVGNDPRLDKCWEDFRNCLKNPPPGQGPDYCLAQLTACQRAAGPTNQDNAGAAESGQPAPAGDTSQQPAGDAGTQAPAGDTGQQTTGDTGTQAPASDQSQQPASDQGAQAPAGDTGQQTAGDAGTQTPAGDAGGQAQQGAASFDADAYFNQTLQSQGYTVGSDPRLDKCWDDFRNCLKSPPPGQGPDYCLAQLTACQRAAGSGGSGAAGDGGQPQTPLDGGGGGAQTPGGGDLVGFPQPTSQSTGTDTGTPPGGQTTQTGSGQTTPSGPPPGVLHRAGDGQTFWQPNPAPPTIGTAANQPAPDDWATGFFKFYGLQAAPGGAAGACVFNGATSTINAVIAIAADQAKLANYEPSQRAQSIAAGVMQQPQPDVISGADPKATPGQSDQPGPAQPQSGNVRVVIDAPIIKLAWDQFLKTLNNPSVAAQWNMWRTHGGPVPPTTQFNFNLTMPAFITPGESQGKLKLTILDEWQASVVFNSEGPRMSDQETLNILKLHLDLPKLHSSLEASLAGVSQGVFFGGPVQAGGQGQVQAAVDVGKGRKVILSFGGQGMGNKDGWNWAAFGSAGVSF